MHSFPPSAHAQMSLGFGQGIPTESLFFAVLPEPQMVARIHELGMGLRDEHGLQGLLLAPLRTHMMLGWMGEHAGVPPALLARVKQAAGRVRSAAFEVCFDQVCSVGDGAPFPLVLTSDSGMERVSALHLELSRVCTPLLPHAPRARPFRPAIPLLHDARRLPPQPVQPMRWLVREFVLLRSYLGQSRYQLEGRWELG